jgi:hypothetical protein
MKMIPILVVLLTSTAMPVAKNGPCPTGYSSSAKFCVPNAGAGVAVPIEPTQMCPSGMTRSGRYCVSRSSH